MIHSSVAILLAALVGAGVPAAVDEGAGVTFRELTAEEASGIDYRRVPSATNAIFERLKAEPLYTMPMLVAPPRNNPAARRAWRFSTSTATWTST